MPEKEKLAEVQALTDTLDTMPETAKQRVLGIAEGVRLAYDAQEKAAKAAEAKEQQQEVDKGA